MSLIRFVGDPFVDAGVAVLECRLGKVCGEFTEADLARQADELEEIYSKKAWMGYLTVHFPNSCWCNPNIREYERRQQKDDLMRSFEKAAIEGRQCVYCHRPAQHVANRKMIPLLTSETTMTCGPGGEPGLTVCSGCLYAVQFYPLAALKIKGKPMFWWTPHHDWMAGLTWDFLRRVERVVEASPEEVTSLNWPSTRLLESAVQVMERADESGGELPSVDLMGCHATNIGQGPEYEEYRLRRGLLEFLRIAERYMAYREIRKAAWQTEQSRKKKAKEIDAAKPDNGKRNALYEDMGAHLSGSGNVSDAVISRYFRPRAGKVEGVSELACIYARKVLEMTQQQVEAIKELAEQIAASKKAEKHLSRLFQGSGLIGFVQTLVDISIRMRRGGEKPLEMATILAAFDLAGEDDATGRGTGLVRELILIRLIEILPQEEVPELLETE